MITGVSIVSVWVLDQDSAVEFTQEPAERPYGIEAILRDDSGNWYSFTQRTV